MRYVYVKNGDAVQQVRRVVEGIADRSGPDAWMGDFLREHRADTVLVLSSWVAADRLSAQRIEARSFRLIRLPVIETLGRGWNALRVGIAILRWRPDRILCGCVAELLWSSVLAARILNVPIVCSRHSGLVEGGGFARLVMKLNAAAIRACRGVVSHGPFLAEQVHKLGVPLHRIHRFEANVRDFGAAHAQARLPEALTGRIDAGDRIVMYVGRIKLEKGAFDLLEAFCGALEDGVKRVRLLYIGSGPHMEQLQAEVARRGQAAHVHLLGQIDHAELPAIMRAATLVVTPTRPELIEGRCKVVFEAFALGVPVIAPNFAAFPHAIQDGSNGLLYAPGSTEDLRAKLRGALTDEVLLRRLQQGTRQSVQTLLADSSSFSSAVEAAFST